MRPGIATLLYTNPPQVFLIFWPCWSILPMSLRLHSGPPLPRSSSAPIPMTLFASHRSRLSRPILRQSSGYALGLGFAALLLLSACSEPTIELEAAQSYTAEWAPTLEASLQEQSASAAASQALKGALAKPDPAQAASEPPYQTLVNQIYRGREYEPAFVKNATLTPAGEALWSALQLVDDHQLESEPFRLNELATLFEQLETRKQAYADFEGLVPTAEEVQFATSWLTEQPVATFALSEESRPALNEALLAAPEGKRLKSEEHTSELQSRPH